MRVELKVSNGDSIVQKFRNAVKYSSDDAQRITEEYGHLFVERVKAHASGRPGPNVVTGMYRDSIRVVEQHRFSVIAGTDAPQAMRLEHGFVGVDSMGRHYNQPGFPHWTPAKDEVFPQYRAAMQAAAREWWR